MIVEVLLFVAVILLWAYLREKPDGFPPGPAGFPILGYMPFLLKNPHITFQQLSKKHGPVVGVRIGRKWVVVINDADILRDALKEDAFVGRPNFPLFLSRTGGKKEGLIFSEGNYWQEQRKFAMRHLKEFDFGKRNMEESVMVHVKELAESLRKEVGKPVDLHFKFHHAVINTLWVAVTGDKFNCEDPKIKKLLDDIFVAFEGENITLNPDLYFYWLMSTFPKLFGIDKFEELLKRMEDMCKESIDKHRKSLVDDNPLDFMDMFLKEIQITTQHDSSFYGKTGERTLLMVMTDLFLAGWETPSSTLYWAFLFLILYPEVQKKIQKEVDEVVGHRDPTLKDRANMPYVEAFIMETLRHSSLIVFSVFHATTQDTVLYGYRIPKGTTIIPNLYAIHRDEKYWDNPEEFRPERFLTSDGQLKRVEACMPFGTGKRQCLGEPLARAEIFLFLTGLVQKFTFDTPPGEHPVAEGHVTFGRQANTYKVILNEREC